jgi:hypothetical protein
LNGVLCSVLANINRSSNTPAFKAEDFSIIGEDKMKKTPEELVAIMNQWTAVKNG